MQWEEVRQTYPDQWVVIEAISAYSNDNKRFVEDIAVLDRFDDSMEALRRHAELHKQKPDHEFYFFHTSRKNLDILEKSGLNKMDISL